MWPFSSIKEMNAKKHDEIDEWHETWKVGDRVEYLGIEMVVEMTWVPDCLRCLTCAYVDRTGRIQREYFYPKDIPLLKVISPQ